MYIKSKLYRKDKIENKDKRFGAADQYYPLWVEDKNGDQHFALFTTRELEMGLERGNRSPVNMKPYKPFHKQVINWVLGLFKFK